MSDRNTLDLLTRLTQVSTGTELAACLEQSLLPLLQPSSCILAWGRAHPQYALVPVYSSPAFPESLLQSFRIADPFFAVPLLESLNVDQAPRVEELEHLNAEKDKLWWSVFRQRQFRTLSVVGSVDLRGKYISYLCLTDATPPERGLGDFLAVLSPVLHDTLGRIRREKKRLQKVKDNPLLTQREQEILEWVRRGKTNAEISAILGIAYPTIKNHVQKIMIKLRANNRTDAVAKALNATHQDETLAPNSWMIGKNRKDS